MNIYVCFSWSENNLVKLSKVFERNSRKYYDPFLIKDKLEIDWLGLEQGMNVNRLCHYFVLWTEDSFLFHSAQKLWCKIEFTNFLRYKLSLRQTPPPIFDCECFSALKTSKVRAWLFVVLRVDSTIEISIQHYIIALCGSKNFENIDMWS